MPTSKQIDTKATCTNMCLLAKTSKFIRAFAPVFTDEKTLALTSVRTGASLETAETEYATSNMLQAQASSVEALRSACRKSRSAKDKAWRFVGSYVQQLSGVTFSALGFINCPLSGN